MYDCKQPVDTHAGIDQRPLTHLHGCLKQAAHEWTRPLPFVNMQTGDVCTPMMSDEEQKSHATGDRYLPDTSTFALQTQTLNSTLQSTHKVVFERLP